MIVHVYNYYIFTQNTQYSLHELEGEIYPCLFYLLNTIFSFMPRNGFDVVLGFLKGESYHIISLNNIFYKNPSL